MKKISIILLLIVLNSCALHSKGEEGKSNRNDKNSSHTDESSVKEITEDGILVGKTKKKDLLQEPFNEWFEAGFADYQPNSELINQIKKLNIDYTITIFMGTWCEDSQNQVPKFYKILKELNFSEEKTTLITMLRDKTTPDLFEKGLKITNVPTFIFFEKGKEVNRIVESPVETLEADILQILSKQPYRHTYAE
ncbi:thioredoxin family protein [Flavobacterium sp. J27]|uniref:thioredoxin family protein n=1 Tax=Flavobacterium sp. J27 TaxID=2060419 RepID=UPI0010308CED|nr:thioredoxin family protein [Flavobacterium sp. J27]